MIQAVDLGENRNLYVISTILIVGIGGLELTIGAVTLTEISTALILGIIANFVLSGKVKERIRNLPKPHVLHRSGHTD